MTDPTPTEPALIHRTTDGREFTDIDKARAHQALLAKIDRFLENRCAESGKKRLRNLLVDWTEQHENTVTGGVA